MRHAPALLSWNLVLLLAAGCGGVGEVASSNGGERQATAGSGPGGVCIDGDADYCTEDSKPSADSCWRRICDTTSHCLHQTPQPYSGACGGNYGRCNLTTGACDGGSDACPTDDKCTGPLLVEGACGVRECSAGCLVSGTSLSHALCRDGGSDPGAWCKADFSCCNLANNYCGSNQSQCEPCTEDMVIGGGCSRRVCEPSGCLSKSPQPYSNACGGHVAKCDAATGNCAADTPAPPASCTPQCHNRTCGSDDSCNGTCTAANSDCIEPAQQCSSCDGHCGEYNSCGQYCGDCAPPPPANTNPSAFCQQKCPAARCDQAAVSAGMHWFQRADGSCGRDWATADYGTLLHGPCTEACY